jgi:hypothetical protein
LLKKAFQACFSLEVKELSILNYHPPFFFCLDLINYGFSVCHFPRLIDPIF